MGPRRPKVWIKQGKLPEKKKDALLQLVTERKIELPPELRACLLGSHPKRDER